MHDRGRMDRGLVFWELLFAAESDFRRGPNLSEHGFRGKNQVPDVDSRVHDDCVRVQTPEPFYPRVRVEGVLQRR